MPALFTPWQKQYYVEHIEAKAREEAIFGPPHLPDRAHRAAYKAALEECLTREVIKEQESYGRRASMDRRRFESLHSNIDRIAEREKEQEAREKRKVIAFEALGFKKEGSFYGGYSMGSILQVLRRRWDFTLVVPPAPEDVPKED